MSIRLQSGPEILTRLLDMLNSGRIKAADPGDKEAAWEIFRLCLILSDIRDGDFSVNEWKNPKRSGAKRNPHSFELALLIHFYKYEEQESWAIVDFYANEWLRARELSELSVPGLKKHYDRYKEEVEAVVGRRDQFLAQYAQAKIDT